MIDVISQEKRLSQLNLSDTLNQVNQKRQVKMKTCADVYNYWRTCKRSYKKAPRNGIEFQVDYIDTGLALSEEQRAKAPVVLALHGAPGSYQDFNLLIQHLSQQNVRVIAPNFPEYIATVKTKVLFRHSADEKAAYLRDFLQAINVFTIDLLVSHSSAIFPTLLILLNANKASMNKSEDGNKCQQAADGAADRVQLDENNNNNINNNNPDKSNVEENDNANIDSKKTAKNDKKRKVKSMKSKNDLDLLVQFNHPIEVRSVALFNPAGHRLPMSMKPEWFKCGSVPIYQQKFGRSLFRKLGPACLTVIGVPVRVDNMDNVMLSATVMRNSKYRRVISQLEQLSQIKLPTLLVFSENDKLIEKEIFYEMTQFMKLDAKTFDLFNNEGNIEVSQSQVDDWIRVMVFKAGGHYAYSNYAKTVNQAVSNLLAKVTQQNNSSAE